MFKNFCNVLQYIRVCAHCGSFFGIEACFCNSCWDKLWRCRNPRCDLKITDYSFNLYSIFIWNSENQIVGSLIKALKEAYFTTIWENLAQYFFEYHSSLHQNPLIIPAPSSSDLSVVTSSSSATSSYNLQSNNKDHAAIWAENLALKNQGSVQICLKRTDLDSKKAQKTKTFTERQQLSLTQIQRPSKKHWIFVDDLITTGSTVRSAAKALGIPPVEVWSLAVRQKGTHYNSQT